MKSSFLSYLTGFFSEPSKDGNRVGNYIDENFDVAEALKKFLKSGG